MAVPLRWLASSQMPQALHPTHVCRYGHVIRQQWHQRKGLLATLQLTACCCGHWPGQRHLAMRQARRHGADGARRSFLPAMPCKCLLCSPLVPRCLDCWHPDVCWSTVSQAGIRLAWAPGLAQRTCCTVSGSCVLGLAESHSACYHLVIIILLTPSHGDIEC